MFFCLIRWECRKRILNATRCKNLFHTPQINFHAKVDGGRSFGKYSCFLDLCVFASWPLLVFSQQLEITIGGVSILTFLCSSFRAFSSFSPQHPDHLFEHLWGHLWLWELFTPTKPLKYFREIASSLWRCRIVHSTLHCRAGGSCILELNKF